MRVWHLAGLKKPTSTMIYKHIVPTGLKIRTQNQNSLSLHIRVELATPHKCQLKDIPSCGRGFLLLDGFKTPILSEPGFSRINRFSGFSHHTQFGQRCIHVYVYTCMHVYTKKSGVQTPPTREIRKRRNELRNYKR